jgi:hypothetical protein
LAGLVFQAIKNQNSSTILPSVVFSFQASLEIAAFTIERNL